MRQNGFFLTFILLLIAQILLCNYFHFTQFITLTILPVMILCIPTRYSTTFALFVAFFTGLAVDLLSDGVMGLNVCALVPVAFVRNGIIRMIFGEDLFSRGDDFTIKRYGTAKVSFAIICAQALFLVVYIWCDGAGTRPVWFNATRFACSLLAGSLLSLFIVDLLTPDDRK